MFCAGKGTYFSSQWLAVSLGLILGTMTALASLVLGQHASLGLTKFHNHLNIEESNKSEEKAPSTDARNAAGVTFLFVLISVGAFYGTISESALGFWRKIYAAVLMAPIGAIVRWQLSSLNENFEWFPFGTFCANILACAISFTSQGIDTRWNHFSNNSKLVLFALRTGLAGSLSTVSTWVTEVRFERIDSRNCFEIDSKANVE